VPAQVKKPKNPDAHAEPGELIEPALWI